MTPDARAQVAREVLTELAEAMGAEGNGGGGRVLRFRDEQFPPPSPVPPPIPLGAVVEDGDGVKWVRRGLRGDVAWHRLGDESVRTVAWGDGTLTALYHARREAGELREQVRQYEEREAAGSFREAPPAPVSSSPPPIPLGAVVTVTVNGVEWQREDGEWDDAEGGGPPNKADALDFLDRIAELERERDEARRELAAQKETANSLISENAAEKENAPTSAPRRWWVVLDRERRVRGTFGQAVAAARHAEWVNAHTSMGPASVVPVIEARVTREQYDRVVRECFCSIPHYGIRAMLAALGLTVEE